MLAGMAYTSATPDTLKLRYPEFADADDARIQYWLDDAFLRVVQQDWSEADGPVAQMLVAAHNLAMGGALGDAGGGGLPAGVTQMRSGALSLSFDEDTVKAQAVGGWAATRYGAQFLALLRLTHGGPRVTRGAVVSGIGCQDVYGRSPHGGFYG